MSGAEKAINRRYVFEACMLSGSVVACNARRVHGDTPGTAEDFGPRGDSWCLKCLLLLD